MKVLPSCQINHKTICRPSTDAKGIANNGIGAIGRKSGCFFCVRIYKNLSKNERENLGFLSSIEVVHGNNELLHSCVYFWGNRVERMDGSGSTVKKYYKKDSFVGII